MKIRIAGFEALSVVDGPGIRFVVFFQGCHHNCDGCHNPQALDPSAGEEYELDIVKAEIKSASGITGVTFSGGEPFLQTEALAELVQFTKELGLNIMLYTGYTYQELADKKDIEAIDKILELADILVDGPFIKSERDISLAFRGSRNQRVIDIQKTRASSKIELFLK